MLEDMCEDMQWHSYNNNSGEEGNVCVRAESAVERMEDGGREKESGIE